MFRDSTGGPGLRNCGQKYIVDSLRNISIRLYANWRVGHFYDDIWSGRQLDVAATGLLTGVSQLCRSGLLPLVSAKNSSCSLRVMGPATPLPTRILSTERLGVISTAVPQKKTSSTMYSISRGMTCTFTGMFRSSASATTVLRVMPGKMLVASGGVYSVP